MKRLKVVAPAEHVRTLRQMAKDNYMAIFQDGKFLKLKWGEAQALVEYAQRNLPEGSFEAYAAYNSGSYGKPGYRSGSIDSLRIKVK